MQAGTRYSQPGGLAPAPQEFLLKAALQRGQHRPPPDHESAIRLLSKLTHLHLDGRNLSTLGSLKQCPRLEVLYLYDNQLQDINCISDNKLLTHLYAQNNQLSDISACKHLPMLQKLYLQQNCIHSIGQHLSSCTRLQELHLSQQQLPPNVSLSFQDSTLAALSSSLRVLHLAACNLSNPAPFGKLRAIRTLDLSSNAIADREQLEAMLDSLQQLQVLDLRGNPCCSAAKYRDGVILAAAGTLQHLDDEPVTANHRAFLQRARAHKRSSNPGLAPRGRGTAAGEAAAAESAEPGWLGGGKEGASLVEVSVTGKKHPLQPPAHRPTAAGGFKAVAASVSTRHL